MGFDPGTSAKPTPKFSYANRHANHLSYDITAQNLYKKGPQVLSSTVCAFGATHQCMEHESGVNMYGPYGLVQTIRLGT